MDAWELFKIIVQRIVSEERQERRSVRRATITVWIMFATLVVSLATMILTAMRS